VPSSGVCTFKSFDEIRALEGFRLHKPISTNTYQRVIGDYLLPEEVRCCQIKKNGNLCLHNHKFGFVVQLQDNSISLLGNTCAQDYAETTRLKADINSYQNEKRRQAQLKQLNVLLSEVAPDINKLKASYSAIVRESEAVKKLRDELEAIVQSIDDMNRNRKWDIQVWAKRDNGKDEEGNKKYKQFSETIGTLKGAEYLRHSRYSELHKIISSILDTYNSAKELSENGTISTLSSKYLSKLASQLNENHQANTAYQNVIADKEAFFRPLNLELLCYLSGDISTRCKLAKFVLTNTGESNSSRQIAKAWLGELDSKYQKILNAVKINAV
jgi:hypothetical protein